MVELNLQTNNDELFLVDGKLRKTYKHLSNNIEKICEALKDKLKSGVILVQIKDRFELASVIFALGHLETTILLINPNWSIEEMKSVLNNSRAKQVITDKEELSVLHTDDVEVLMVSDLTCGNDVESKTDVITISGDILMCTTGTTSEPKIVARSWEGIFKEVDVVMERLHYSQSDCIFAVAQWTHSLGFVDQLVAGVRVLAKLVVAQAVSTPTSWARTMKYEGATIIVGVPTFYSFLIQADEEVSTIKFAVSAGAPMPQDIYEKFRNKFLAPLLHIYGCTEEGNITMQFPENESAYPSVGKALPDVEITILDEQGMPVEPGKIGYIHLKSARLAHTIIKNGEFIPMDPDYDTGDQGFMTAEGDLIVVGRNNRRIKVNGFGVHPGEVEQVLLKHPKIIESIVVAEYDERRGTTLVAYVRSEEEPPTELELRSYCQERLAPYKNPHRYIFVKSFNRDEKGQIKL